MINGKSGEFNQIFYSDINNNELIEGFYYSLSINKPNLNDNIPGNTEFRLASTEMVSKQNLLIMIKDEYVYNNPYLTIYYKIDTTYKKLCWIELAYNSTSVRNTRFVFTVKLEDKEVNCEFKLHTSDYIFRHFHKSNGSNPVVEQTGLGIESKGANLPQLYSNLVPSQGNITYVPNEYYPINSEHILNLNRREIPQDTASRDQFLFMQLDPKMIDPIDVNGNESGFINKDYFDVYEPKYYQVNTLASEGVIKLTKTEDNFYVKLFILGGRSTSAYSGWIILTPTGCYSNFTNAYYLINNDSLYIRLERYPLYKIDFSGCELDTFDSSDQVTLVEGTYLSLGNFIEFDTTSQSSVTLSDIFNNYIPFTLLYKNGLPIQSSAYGSIKKSRVLEIDADDLVNDSVPLYRLMSKYNVSINENIVITLNKSLKNTVSISPISIQVNVYYGYVTILADYGRKINLVDSSNNILYEVRNSKLLIKSNSNSIDIIKEYECYPIFWATYPQSIISAFGDRLGPFPDLSKYWIKIFDSNGLVCEGMSSTMEFTNESVLGTDRIRVRIYIGARTFTFYIGNVIGQSGQVLGIQMLTKFNVNKLNFLVGIDSTSEFNYELTEVI